MTDTRIEETLRATLAARAATVTSGPDWQTADAGVAHRAARRRNVRWLAPLAAAAVVGAVVASVIAIEDRSGGRHIPPATHRPSGSPTSGAPTNTTPTPNIPLACRAALPAEWEQAIHNSLVDIGGTTARPLSVTPDGGILVARDFGPLPGSARDVVRVERGNAPEVIYQVPDPDTYDIASATQVDHWLVVALRVLARPDPGEVPGSASNDVHRILVIDLQTGQHRVVARTSIRVATPGGRTITNAATLGRAIYWDERPKYLSQTAEVKKYDLATGRTTVVYHGPRGYPVASAAGFGLAVKPAERIEAPVAIPDVVAGATDARMRATLATDGRSWAWIAGPHEIGWWADYVTGPKLVRLRGPALTGPDYYPNPPVVSGRFVFPPEGADQVVDMLAGARTATGASAPIPDYRPHTRGSVASTSGPFGTLAGYVELGPAGHFVQGYWQDTPFHVLRIDTRGLPGLAC